MLDRTPTAAPGPSTSPAPTDSHPTLGCLPCLRHLNVKLMRDMMDCPNLAQQLAQLQQLTELVMTKCYSQNGKEIPSQADQEESTTLERLLHSLRRLKRLRVLRVAAIYDDVLLSRSILPSVQQL